MSTNEKDFFCNFFNFFPQREGKIQLRKTVEFQRFRPLAQLLAEKTTLMGGPNGPSKRVAIVT